MRVEKFQSASSLSWEASGMDNEELTGLLKEIADSMRRAQALSLANSFVLAEIVRQLADAATNRHDYLVGMFERLSARAERARFDEHARPANGLLRVELSKFFAEVAGSPKAPKPGDRPASGTPSRNA
jgi:hypothetical protein